MSLTSDPPVDRATGPRHAAPADGHNTLTVLPPRHRRHRSEATAALGIPRNRQLRRIVLPQTMRSVLQHHVERHQAKGATR
ncbi:hypothetical protein [Streptomyces sp. NBC_00893]|uniref:hypothetical protein n=1 Tax=Streptomyces sp. NBC_00893 TaxID=2975862 RepID=UPI002258157A|nr:hypothetical protein [Streptomyces sp. NBC_00893]MCX4848887.1 hypothetical protein [Streptomyces sp. NBC_00893]